MILIRSWHMMDCTIATWLVTMHLFVKQEHSFPYCMHIDNPLFKFREPDQLGYQRCLHLWLPIWSLRTSLLEYLKVKLAIHNGERYFRCRCFSWRFVGCLHMCWAHSIAIYGFCDHSQWIRRDKCDGNASLNRVQSFCCDAFAVTSVCKPLLRCVLLSFLRCHFPRIIVSG